MSLFSSTFGQHFSYAHGRIGVLKQSLMSQTDVDRLLGSHDGKEAERILTEMKLTNGIDQGLSTWQEILSAVESWVYTEATQMCPQAYQPVFFILWMQNDAPLLAYLLKKYHQHTSDISREPEPGLHWYDPEAIRALVEEDVPGTLPSHLVTFVRSVKEKEAIDVDEIDHAVYQYVTDTQLTLARTSGSAHIRRYVQHSIDVMNIRTALRFVDHETDEVYEDHFITGGTLQLTSKHNSLEKIAVAIEKSPLPFFLADALRKADQNPNVFERAFSDVLAEDIAHMWNVPLTIEPLFAFAAIALSDIRLIRSILIGKSNHLSPQEIKQIIPPFIPASHYITS